MQEMHIAAPTLKGFEAYYIFELLIYQSLTEDFPNNW